MDEQRDEEEEPTPGPSRVRIVGAEPAGTLVGAGDTPPAEPEVAAEPEAPEAAFGHEAAGTELPHWTEAPTGEVPAVLQRGGNDEGDEADPWSALPGPTWRQEDTDWEAHEETFEPSMLAGDDERHGSLDESADTGERQPWSFDLPGTEVLSAVSSTEPPGDDTVIIPAAGAHRAAEDVAFGFDEGTATVAEASGVGRGRDETEAIPTVPAAAEVEPPAAAGGSEAEDERPAPRRGLGRHGLRLPSLREAAHRPAEPAEAEAHDEPGDSEGDDGGDLLVARTRTPHRTGRARRQQGTRPQSVPVVEGRQPPSGNDVPWPRPGAGRSAAPASERPGERNLPVAVASGLILGVIVLVFFKLGTVTSMIVVTAVLTMAAMEVYAAFRRTGYHPVTLFGLVATVSLLIATYQKGYEALPLVAVLLFTFTMLWQLFGVDASAEPLRSAASTLFVFAWIGVFGSFAALLLNPTLFPNRHGIAFLLGAVIAEVAYDVGALAVGRWAGRHPLSAASPNKTWEGVAGGGVAALLAAVIVVHLIHPWTLGSAAALGLVVAVVSPIGDLSESLVKRRLGLKDMGRLLPGHGGLVDRIDGLLFVIPATFYLVKAFHLG